MKKEVRKPGQNAGALYGMSNGVTEIIYKKFDRRKSTMKNILNEKLHNSGEPIPSAEEFEMMTAKEVQEHLGIGERQTYELMNQPEFPSFKIGRSIRVPKVEFRKWIQEQIEQERDKKQHEQSE